MFKQLFQFIGLAGLLAVSSHSAQATTYQDVTLGGVNLTSWCVRTHGNGFKARLIANNAGGWSCERSAGDRRPISVNSACKMQYGKRAYRAKALDWSDPYSWKCLGRVAVPTMKGVNLTPWCQSVYGNTFKAKLIRNDAGGWTCEQSAGNRRPIQVSAACKLQYGSIAYKAKALDWSDPYSWKCLLH